MDEVEFGRYRLISLIGEGGMGKVYKAHDTMIDRDVAIKVLITEMADEPGYRARFRREAHTAARLNEPHIIPIYDTGEIDGRLYLVMPIIDGTDVASLLRSGGPMTPELAVSVIDQLASALDTAHNHGLVHRDVKPSNALMTPRKFVYLIDFGIAHDAAATRLTRTNTVVGSFAYMAPERFTTGDADARADVYALACVLHECLTAEMPYPATSLEQIVAAHLNNDRPKPSAVNAAVPASFDEVVARGMAKNPEHRYQSASELAGAARLALAGASAAQSQSTAIDDDRPDAATTASPRQAEPAAEDSATGVLRTRVLAVRELVNLRSPSMPFAVAVVLALAAVAVAFFGLGAPPHGGNLPPGTVTIAGADPTGSGEVAVDLSKPIPVAVTAGDPDSVALGLDILGASVGQHHQAALTPDPAGRTTTLPPPVNRHLLAGNMTAQITVLRGDTPLGTYRFMLTSTQRATTTVTAGVTLVLVLLAVAYLESNLRVLRRGRESVAAVLAVPLFAAILAVGAVSAAWILLGHPPTVATLAWSAALAGAAGIAAVIGAGRVGRRARSRRSGRTHP